MKTIALINRKGGVGKSALAIALAVESELRGNQTIVIDTDEQASVFKWSKRRESASPYVVASQLVQVPDYLEQARNAGAGFAIIDTAGQAGPSTLEIARLSDLVIIPTGPSIRDIEALSIAFDVADMAKKPHLIVLNKIRPNSMRKFNEIRQELVDIFSANVFSGHISLRQAQEDADLRGLAPQEHEPKTATEISVLYNAIDNLLSNNQTSNIESNQTEAPSV